jgi:hypothetical protein
MKLIFRKLVPVIIIASMLLSACGVEAPEDIDWNTAEENTSFSDVDNNANLPEVVPGVVPTQPPEPEVNEEIPWDEIVDEKWLGKDKIHCENHEGTSCQGDVFLGSKCIGDTCYIFVDGQAYIVPEDKADNLIERVSNLRSDIRTRYKAGIGLSVGIGLSAIGATTIVTGVAATTTSATVATSAGVGTVSGTTVATTTATTIGGAELAAGIISAIVGFVSGVDDEKFSNDIGFLYKELWDNGYDYEQVPE